MTHSQLHPPRILALIDSMLESEAYFEAAARSTPRTTWSSMFRTYVVQRREFAQQLSQFLPTTQPLQTPAPVSLPGTDEKSILETLIQSGHRTAGAFRLAMVDGNLGDALPVVREQAFEVEHTLQQLVSLLAAS